MQTKNKMQNKQKPTLNNQLELNFSPSSHTLRTKRRHRGKRKPTGFPDAERFINLLLALLMLIMLVMVLYTMEDKATPGFRVLHAVVLAFEYVKRFFA